MRGWLPYVAVALLSSVATVLGTVAIIERQSGSGDVRAYLLANPEVIPEAMERLRQKQAVAQIEPRRRALETPYAGAFIGAANGDVTVVQFFDYACGYCRTSWPDLQRLVAEDPKVRVVFRELPILSRESDVAARASLAVAEQGGYARFHEALYALGRPSESGIVAAARAAGADPGRMRAAMASPRPQQEVAQNVELARALGFTGTPSWVIGNQVLSGAVGYEALKKAVAAARAAS